MKTPSACPSCGAETMELFCSRCGEQRPTRRDFSLLHYLKQAFHTLSDLDSKLLGLSWSFFFIVWLFRFFLFEVTLRSIEWQPHRPHQIRNTRSVAMPVGPRPAG